MKKLISALILILLSILIFGCIGSPSTPGQSAGGQDASKYGITGKGTKDEPYILSAREGRITIPLAIVREGIQYYSYNGTKFFTLKDNEGVQMRISICEPCRGYSFHLQNNGREVVCDACGTTWSASNFRGISGGCIAYPPPYLASSASGNSITAKTSDIERWSEWFK